MNRFQSANAFLLAAATCIQFAILERLPAADLYKPFKIIAEPFQAAHRKKDKPPTGADDNIEQLAKEIDWLEHHIDKYGTIVAKHPDVWGQSRLMRHRYEYEKQMAAQLDHFEVRMNAALRRTDQAFLGMAFAIQGAAKGSTVPSPTESGTILQNLNAMIPSTNQVAGAGANADPNTIARTAPLSQTIQNTGLGFSFSPNNLSLEPTIQLDQMSRYLNHLHELRRINEGDDIADSPGYSLNLVRIPVSVLPGKQTQKGYGAEITVIAAPFLGEDLLPTTFRNLVVNDVVDTIAPILTSLANDKEFTDDLKEIAVQTNQPERAQKTGATSAIDPIIAKQRWPASQNYSAKVKSELNKPKVEPTQGLSLLDKVRETVDKRSTGIQTIPAAKTRRARLPLPLTQVSEVFGKDRLIILTCAVLDHFSSQPTSHPYIEYVDVRAYLHEELEAAYDFLGGNEFSGKLWTFCDHRLADAIRERRMRWLDGQRCRFFNAIGTDTGEYPRREGEVLHDDHSYKSSQECCKTDDNPFEICKSVTAALAWSIIVESALLNDRLVEDMREAAAAKGCHCAPEQAGPFFGPDPCPEARQAFNEYVKCRWPIRVFALDPVSQDQNIADAYARRRELQVAIALAFAGGQMNAQSMMRYTRRLEWDMATIDINHTSVGFSHGNDTFGWRFNPRFQTPPIKGNIATFGETLFGGPTTASDLRQRKLEAGQRECTAIVVMPSFVPYVTFDVRTNWYKLTNPKQTEVSLQDTMTLSRSIKTMQESAAMCAQSAHLYRDGEVHRLLRRVDQLDRELPLQTMQAQIPYENTSGGFELFNTGITDLAPELIGWYGAPGINPNGTTTLYLIGKGFSVHSTQLLAGGRNVPFNLISRQVMQVEIPSGVQVLKRSQEGEARFDEVVDVHMATPYGVSSHLLVPVAKVGAALSAGDTELTIRPDAQLDLTFIKVDVAGPPTSFSTTVDSFFSFNQDAIVMSCPKVFAPPASPSMIFYVTEAETNLVLGQFTRPSIPFNPRAFEYYITAKDLVDLVGSSTIDNTLAKTLSFYLTTRLNQGKFGQKDSSVQVVVKAVMVPTTAGAAPIPLNGSFRATITRRN